MVALYDYDKRADTDISFRKDDRMEVLDDNGNAEWWHVNNLRSEESGWVPQNYVAPERSINSEEYVLFIENFNRIKSTQNFYFFIEFFFHFHLDVVGISRTFREKKPNRI